jgi:hypothetical protein
MDGVQVEEEEMLLLEEEEEMVEEEVVMLVVEEGVEVEMPLVGLRLQVHRLESLFRMTMLQTQTSPCNCPKVG